VRFALERFGREVAIAFAVLTVALVLVVALTTPWHPVGRPVGGRVPVDVSADFDPTYLHRENAYHHQLWPAVLGQSRWLRHARR